MSQPAFAALVHHSVADYETWRPVYDAHKKTRAEAGMVGEQVHRDVADPNQVWLYFAATDRARLEGFFKSPDLKDTMMKAGVQGPPTLRLMKPVSSNPVMGRETAGLVVIHEVADFDAWKKVYDSLAEVRTRFGVTGDAVNQLVDSPKTVVVYHQADSIEALRAFAESSELKDAMGRAGVVSKPQMTFVRSLGLSRY